MTPTQDTAPTPPGGAQGPETPTQAPQGHPGDSVPAKRRTERQPPPLIRHGACGKTWTGITRAHCSKCHETFSSGAFDPHQRIPNGVVVCSTNGLIAHAQPWGTLWKLPDNGYWNEPSAHHPSPQDRP